MSRPTNSQKTQSSWRQRLWLFCCLFPLHTVLSAEETSEGFALPVPGRVFAFPRDHGSHPEFKIEWWYVTGHLFAEDGQRFGFQATFFRQANRSAGVESLLFQQRQLYLAHMALLDARTGRFLHEERLNRGGWNADSSTTTLDVTNGNWSLRLTDPVTSQMALKGTVKGEASLDLQLTPAKPLVFFGKDGVSRKAAQPSAASHYLTFPRLKTTGTLQLDAKTKLSVTGDAWMDHEISSSQLGEGQIGWDWLSIQFRDERELMLYRLRLRDGTADPASTLTWVDAASRNARRPFTWEVLDRWTSPTTGASYPSRIRVTTTDPANNAQVEYTIEPLAAAQELSGSVGGIPYWEGACRVLDAAGKEVGSAYMELTGYASELKL